LLTSVTLIASIPSREADVYDAGRGMTLKSPPLATDEQGMAGRLASDGNLRDALSQFASKNITVTVQRGDTITSLLRQHMLDWREVLASVRANSEVAALYDLRPGEIIKLRVDHQGHFEELHYALDPASSLQITRSGDAIAVDRETRQLETRIAYVTGTVETSLFDDGQIAGLSDALILKFVEIFGWDIDFALQVRPGDTFSVVHEEKYWMGQKVSDGAILAAEFINRNVPFRAFALRDTNGYTEYFSEQGMSMRRTFLRTPVEFSRISSRYSKSRFHPVLKSWRAHQGVDYAAPTGTPVRSTAKGRVLFVGQKGGYGNVVIVTHGGKYSTLYAHLSRFPRGLRVGSFVDQGQIIGYVGKSGLATGSHLHYEFRINDIHKDPLAIRFPGATPVPAEQRDAFFHSVHLLTADLERIRYPRFATVR
jgi:murein DD-endopeptidase MepM/ murein hydrolase activator NlpD